MLSEIVLAGLFASNVTTAPTRNTATYEAMLPMQTYFVKFA